VHDVTALLDAYRECARHLWNTYFHADAKATQDWDIRDQFLDVAVLLLRSLVLSKVGRDDIPLLPDYRGDQAPISAFHVVVGVRSEVMVARAGVGGYWDDPLRALEPNDCELRFIQFFDWDHLGVRDFAFYRVRIVASDRYPHLIGRDALLPVGASVKVLCERAAQQADAADEARRSCR
jgi:hypothetical protein